MDPELQAQLDNITEATADELTAISTAITDAAAALAEDDSPEAIETLTALADAAEQVRTTQTERATAAAERETQRDELLNRINPVAEETPEETPEEEPEETPTTTTETETETTTTTETPAEVPTPEAVAAAAVAKVKPPSVPKTRRVRVTEPVQDPAVLVAAGDLGHFSTGQHLSIDQLHQAFMGKAQASAATRGGKGRSLVASMRWSYPEDRTLDPKSGENLLKIDPVLKAVESPDALAASGGLCAPVAVRYELDNVSTISRPIRDQALVRFGASRGGVRFVTPPSLVGLAGATRVWTVDDDIAAVDDVEERKPCLRIDCGAVQEALISAVTLCLEAGNFARMTFPEQFSTFFAKGRSAHARLAEQTLFARMSADSDEVNIVQQGSGAAVLGATRTILEGVTRVSARARSVHRMADDATVRAILPNWVQDLIVTDLALQAPGDDAINIARATVSSYFTSRNIAVVWSPDIAVMEEEIDGADARQWPDTFEALIYHEGAHLFLDDGELDFGTEIRDSTLNARNDVQAFMETFEGTAFTGEWSRLVNFDVCPSGVAQAAQAIDLCGAGGIGS